jgi:hypothetical protein
MKLRTTLLAILPSACFVELKLMTCTFCSLVFVSSLILHCEFIQAGNASTILQLLIVQLDVWLGVGLNCAKCHLKFDMKKMIE